METTQTVYRITTRRSSSDGRREIRTGCQSGVVGNSWWRPTQVIVGAARNGAQGQKVRDGTKHQNGADEADAGPSAAGVGQPTHAGSASASVGIDVSVSETILKKSI